MIWAAREDTGTEDHEEFAERTKCFVSNGLDTHSTVERSFFGVYGLRDGTQLILDTPECIHTGPVGYLVN